MNKILSETIRIIREQNIDSILEAGITSLIYGILYSQGWNVFDPYEVVPQHEVSKIKPKSDHDGYEWNSKKKVDLAVELFDCTKIFIEIKKSDQKLVRHEKQLKNYLLSIPKAKIGLKPEVPIGVLTNATSWWFYEILNNKYNQIKVVRKKTVNIDKDNDFDIERIFSNYLSRDKMVEEWYETNINILNSNTSQRMSAIRNLRKMKDKRVIEPFKKIIIEDNGANLKSVAFEGIIELYDKNDLKTFLKETLHDPSPSMRERAEKHLEKIK